MNSEIDKKETLARFMNFMEDIFSEEIVLKGERLDLFNKMYAEYKSMRERGESGPEVFELLNKILKEFSIV